ncbi:MAG: succinylglutamate desuccinylase/aspartoacylase family protein [Caldilineaceae bacterium]|nr:succinylglutamate desuccinylase/aspartoacylase family protein [Caldilineaceae bacterium]
MKINSQIYTDLNYEKEGKQFGQLEVPISTNTAGWANYYLPACVIKNGEGPTALIFGGNHGDEYEGPVTLMNLAREIQPEQVQGRVILLPMLNRPAVMAGTRLSSVDGRNMNRAFYTQYPEIQVNESITTMIAHYMTQALIPLADLVIDIHSGGRSIHFLPSVNMHRVANEEQMQAMLAAGLAWDAPYVFIYRDVAGEGLLPSYCERLGKVTLGTELGSASQFSPEILGIAARGVKNVLRQSNILVDTPFTTPAQPAQVVAAEQREDYVMAPMSGIYEPFLEMGAAVETGQPIGQLHLFEQPFAAPQVVVARSSGILFARRSFPLTQQGDCVAVVVRPYQF